METKRADSTAGDIHLGRLSEKRYVRPADVVKQTGLSKSAVMAALWAGELEAYRKGKAWLIPVEAIDQWIRGNDHAA